MTSQEQRAADGLVLAYANRAAALAGRGADADGIDTAMRLGCGLPTGPLELLDRMGLDTALAELEARHRDTGDPAYTPAPVLRHLVATGRLGEHVGEGFHRYGPDSARSVPAPPPPGDPGPVRQVGVVGTGTMARGIAECCSVAGLPTVLVARTDDRAAIAAKLFGQSLDRSLKRGRLTVDIRAEAGSLLATGTDISALRDCDLVVEAVVEDLAVKQEVFARIGAACGPGTVLATTTSSLSVAACAAASGRPADVLGLHFFNPAPVMRLVELVRTPDTADRAVTLARTLCARLGKTPVDCPDTTGFIVNYLLFPYLGRALTLLERGEVGAAALDAAVEQGHGYPMGPFALLDTIGLDVSLAIQRKLSAAYDEPDFAPSALLTDMVRAGMLGRKNRRGLRTDD